MNEQELLAEIDRLRKLLFRAGHKLKVMVDFGQVPARHEFDCLIQELCHESKEPAK